MANAEKLYSKTFKGGSDEITFKAKTNFATVLIERMENVSTVGLFIKGTTEFVTLPVLTSPLKSERICEIKTIPGHTYKLCMTSSGCLDTVTVDGEEETVQRKSSALISAIWEEK